MELHIRTSEGTICAKVKGQTAFALRDVLSEHSNITSSFKKYSGLDLDSVLTYKVLRSSSVVIGDIEFTFWVGDYIYLVI